MLDLSIVGAVAVFLLLIGYSGYKAISATNQKQQDAAYRVLKLVLAAVTGVSVVAVVVLHRAGLM